jgi:hypothetical protein
MDVTARAARRVREHSFAFPVWWTNLTPMIGTSKPHVDAEIVGLITRVLRENVQAFGLHDVSVRAGEDHDGDAALFIDATYDLTDTPVDMAVTAGVTSTLRERLWAEGETRFPYVRHVFPEAQKIKPLGRVGA